MMVCHRVEPVPLHSPGLLSQADSIVVKVRLLTLWWLSFGYVAWPVQDSFPVNHVIPR